MKRKITALCVVIAMLTVAIVGGTMAYFTDTDAQVNVMTMGNVKIEQLEYEWNDDGQLQPFTQEKELLPYVGELGWANTEKDNGAYRTFTMNNVLDKYVTVKNTGKSDAFVRTFIAIEVGNATDAQADLIGLSLNARNGSEFQFKGAWDWENLGVTTIDGNRYFVYVATHYAALDPNEETVPSLLQVYLSKDATNEDAEALDGNGNGLYEILAFTQGVQAAGFESADEALDEAFGAPSITGGVAENLPWGDEFVIPEYVSNSDELRALLAKIKADSSYWNSPVVIELAANTYGGEIVIDQYPEWNGVVDTSTANNMNTAGGVGNATQLIFKANGDVVFTGDVIVNGWGNAGNGFAQATNAYTTFEGVTFDAANSIEANNKDYIALKIKAAANNVTLDDCTFQNATHVTVGGSGADGAGKVTFTGCEFNNGGCISGYVETLNVSDTVVTKADKGFINKAKAGAVTVTNCTVNSGEYVLRTANSGSGVHFNATDSTFTVYEVDGLKNLVNFRGSGESATFTNCEITPGYTTAGVDANSTLTIDGVAQ